MAAVLGVSPTRMELIKLRRRITLAERGHDLLKEKMDALVMEFFEVLKDIQVVREKATKVLMEAHRALSLCLAEMGTVETLQAMRETRREATVEILTRYIMGVPVPKVEAQFARGVLERGYSLHGTSAVLDRAAKSFEGALGELVKQAELEASAYSLARELERTKRRVNALEYILIPRLRETIKFIQGRLDEMERENFTRLKRIKAILEERF
jgi:V/A-type H+-transporting ATPase subunit D